MKNLSPKARFRCSFLFVCVIISLGFFVYTFSTNVAQIVNNKNLEKQLKEEYANASDTEEELKEEINKLQDPEYMARYAREKYLYSANDEIIIKLEE